MPADDREPRAQHVVELAAHAVGRFDVGLRDHPADRIAQRPRQHDAPRIARHRLETHPQDVVLQARRIPREPEETIDSILVYPIHIRIFRENLLSPGSPRLA
nr:MULTISPECIES: hypothetical protein [unclassified Burkholderia]